MNCLLSTAFFAIMMILSIQTGTGYQYRIPRDILNKMSGDRWKGLNVNLSKPFDRRPYVLNKDNQSGWNVFRIAFKGIHSHYTFTRHCEMNRIVRRMLSTCHTIEKDNRSVAIVRNQEFHRTGNIKVKIVRNPSDPHSITMIYLAPQINMRLFTFQIFAVEEKNKKRLVAQVNASPPGSSRLPIPDAYTFIVDIPDETNDEEVELILILCLMIDEMRNYVANDDDNKEDFYNND